MWVSAVGAPPQADENLIMRPKQNPHLPQPGTPAAVGDLHICVLCGSELVHPCDWEAEGPRHWRVFLRCPECEGIREGLFTQPAVDLLADELDRGSAVLGKALDLLTRENMTEEVEVLVRALDGDLILPSDF